MTVALREPRADFANAVIGGHLYVFGGWHVTKPYHESGSEYRRLDTVDRAPIRTAVSLGAFEEAGRTNVSGRILGSARVGGDLYLFGSPPGTVSLVMDRATIGTNRELSPFRATSLGMPAGRDDPGSCWQAGMCKRST